ncbi:molybdenum cofactor biosynthesis protein MoaE [Arthrobacter sp. NPDC097144]|uniref:molybdenum cofactor biosynthesis protein MoaE n=1 Tax=Arthrobacter sp. NPDC097144 TaxID=3363946 RepID=UPI00382625BB
MSTETPAPEGANAMSEVINATVSDLPLNAEHANGAAWSPECGAVVGFSGIVRNHDGGRGVATLSYSAHPSAEEILAAVAADVADKYDGVRIWVGHRTGPLQIGEAALVAAVASAHRGVAFAACSELVDTVKARVPIWKEQGFSDGTTEWVGVGEADDVQDPPL